MQQLTRTSVGGRPGRPARLVALLVLLVLAAPQGAAAAGGEPPSYRPALSTAVTVFDDAGTIDELRDGFWRTVLGVCPSPQCQRPTWWRTPTG